MITMKLTDERRLALKNMIARQEASRLEIERAGRSLNEMVAGAQFLAMALNIGSGEEEDFWAEVADLIETDGEEAVYKLVR
jgi:hypothetical protein